MAYPVSDTYTAGADGSIYAGRLRPVPHAALLDAIAAVPNNSWVKVNANPFSDAWPPADYRPLFGSAAAAPISLIRAWSSFGWDTVNHRMILWGGGHANYSGNEVYVWSGVTRQWALGFHSSDVAGTSYRTIDGGLNTPQSSHTYDSQHYLPILNRFITFGGAAQSSGGPFAVFDGATDTVLRSAVAYTLDLSQAGQGKVAGTTGSNVHRGTTVGVTLQGASAWYLRDYLLDRPDAATPLNLIANRISCGGAYRQENGHDVIYQTGRTSGGTGHNLTRIEFVDQNYHNDIISTVGVSWDDPTQDGAAALDPIRNVFLATGDATYPLYGWDLNANVPRNFRVAAVSLVGAEASAFLAVFTNGYGLDYDPVNARFVLWSRGGAVWSVKHSGADLTTGWTPTLLNDGSAATRPGIDAETGTQNTDSGVFGKFQWASDLKAFVALQHNTEGNVWVYRPHGWTDPRGN